jgi:sarcosine oxidase subunit gamma
MANAIRIHPLADQVFAANTVLLKPEPARTRISLRAGSKELDAINKILALNLPTRPKSSTISNERIAMWIGPDEWLILDNSKSNLSALPKDLSDILCSAVDISHRNTAISITGSKAAQVMNAGCPQNLSLDAFPVGACSRTVLGKSEIILWRTATDAFHVECWRSFSDYVWKYLVDAAKTA